MKRFVCAFTAFIIFVLTLSGCGNKKIETPQDVIGKRIAVLENSSSVIFAKVYGGEIRLCSDKKELTNAVKLGDVDCALVDEKDEGYVKRFQFGVKTLKEPFMDAELRIAAARENPDLIDDINDAIYYLDDERILGKMIKGYYDEEEFVYEHKKVPEDAKTLTVAVCDQSGPYCYFDENGQLRGIDIDIAIEICAYLGLNCKFEVMDQDELIPAVWGGAAHFAMGCLTDSSENAEICIMSDPYVMCTQKILVN